MYKDFGLIVIDDARIDETCNAYFKWKDLNTYISNNSRRGMNMPDAISEPMGCYCLGLLWNRGGGIDIGFEKTGFFKTIYANEIDSFPTKTFEQNFNLKVDKSGVIPTLTANQGEGGHNVCIIKSKHGIRKMTPLECFYTQGFPKTFIIPKELSDAKLYKQAGNSVCVTVIERIQLYKHIFFQFI